MTDFSHAMVLRIAAEDYHAAALAEHTDDQGIMCGIVATHLYIAAKTPKAELEALYEEWALSSAHHVIGMALTICLLHLDQVMMPADLLPEPV